jgi:hypothetical protein
MLFWDILWRRDWDKSRLKGFYCKQMYFSAGRGSSERIHTYGWIHTTSVKYLFQNSVAKNGHRTTWPSWSKGKFHCEKDDPLGRCQVRAHGTDAHKFPLAWQILSEEVADHPPRGSYHWSKGSKFGVHSEPYFNCVPAMNDVSQYLRTGFALPGGNRESIPTGLRQPVLVILGRPPTFAHEDPACIPTQVSAQSKRGLEVRRCSGQAIPRQSCS